MAVALTGARLSVSSEEEELKERETIAIFITKVWKLVETPEYNKYIHWSDVSSPIIEWHLLIYTHILRMERRLWCVTIQTLLERFYHTTSSTATSAALYGS